MFFRMPPRQGHSRFDYVLDVMDWVKYKMLKHWALTFLLGMAFIFVTEVVFFRHEHSLMTGYQSGPNMVVSTDQGDVEVRSLCLNGYKYYLATSPNGTSLGAASSEDRFCDPVQAMYALPSEKE